jgi:hypothetical protein
VAKEIAYTYDIYIGAPVAKVWKGLVDGSPIRPLRKSSWCSKASATTRFASIVTRYSDV